MSTTDDLHTSCGDTMIIIRHRHLFMADNNHCAAAILDDLVAEIATREERAWMDASHGKYSKGYNLSYSVQRSIGKLTDRMSGLFTVEDVVSALNLLIDKQIIGNQGRVEDTEDCYIFLVHKQYIDQLSKDYWDQLRPTQPLVGDDMPDSAEEPAQSLTAPVTAEPSTAGQSQKARRSETRRIEYHNSRASRVGLAATLTLAQWMITLEDFNYKCAFCSDGNYEVVEHFIPLIHGGGTTEYNCLPACARCNSIKHDSHPMTISDESPMHAAIQAAHKYLENRRLQGVQ